MRVTLLFSIAGILLSGGCNGKDPQVPHNFFVRFSSVNQADASAARDTIIRSSSATTFVIHTTLPDSCLQENPPPRCPPLPLLQAQRTDTIIR